jgi:hypothetical protein
MTKRYRKPQAKPGELKISWASHERGDPPCLVYSWGDGISRGKSDGAVLSYFFETHQWPEKRTLAAELDARGYDLTTLRFSIQKKAAGGG